MNRPFLLWLAIVTVLIALAMLLGWYLSTMVVIR